MSNTKCERCSFNNPSGSVSAVVINNGRMLFLKRNEEPFKDMWDLPGGFMSGIETPLQAIKRELKEELGIKCKPKFIKEFMGYAEWKGELFPVINSAFLVVIDNEDIILNEENSEYKWEIIDFIDSSNIAFDSNQRIVEWVKANLNFDLDRVKELVNQLDSTATVSEQSLYNAVLNGYVSKVYDSKKLVGLGWIFIRQTMLRKQAVIDDMIVDDKYRGKGLGRKILKELIQWAKEMGVDVIELTTGHHRVAAGKLYESEGFVFHDTRHMLKKI